MRVQLAVYATGLFSATQAGLIAVVMPLWLLRIEASPVMIGLAVGSYNLLPFLFSIQGGALMDRLGARRVMLAFALVGAAVPLLYPLLPFVWAVLGLQMVAGLAATMGWVGAQTLVGQVMHARPDYAGRFTFFGVLGNFVGPPLAGAAWDALGPWGGFGVLFAWTVFQLCAVLALPEGPAPNSPRADRLQARDLAPALDTYTSAFRMLALPMVAFVVMLSMMRLAGHAIQGSFYVVFLNADGISGAAIGVLLASGALAAAAGALLAAPLARAVNSSWLLLVTSFLSVLAITVAPLLGLYLLYMSAQIVRGASVGISTPLIITEMSLAVGPDQGKAVGLRTMSNRLTSTVTPIAMGGLVALVGLKGSFVVAAAIACGLMVGVALFARAKRIL